MKINFDYLIRFGTLYPTKSQVLKSVRASLMFFGVDTSVLSDDELEDGLIRVQKRISECGISFEEYAAKLQRLRI